MKIVIVRFHVGHGWSAGPRSRTSPRSTAERRLMLDGKKKENPIPIPRVMITRHNGSTTHAASSIDKYVSRRMTNKMIPRKKSQGLRLTRRALIPSRQISSNKRPPHMLQGEATFQLHRLPGRICIFCTQAQKVLRLLFHSSCLIISFPFFLPTHPTHSHPPSSSLERQDSAAADGLANCAPGEPTGKERIHLDRSTRTTIN